MQNFKEFEKAPFITFQQGLGNLPKITLKHENNSSAEVYLHGAHVTSYKTCKGEELLFVSPKAIFSEEKAIRGGIPICFPQFGPGKMKQHGFARDTNWHVKSTLIHQNNPQVTLALFSDEQTRKLWDHSFEVNLILTLLPDQLDMQLVVINKNKDVPFTFTTAFHTYFDVKNVKSAVVYGLDGLKYFDRVNTKEGIQEGEFLQFTKETDRTYFNAKNIIKLIDAENDKIVKIEKEGLNDIVVWNPFPEKAKSMNDLGEENWKNMVCVETGQIGEPIKLEPTQIWKGRQILKGINYFNVPPIKSNL